MNKLNSDNLKKVFDSRHGHPKTTWSVSRLSKDSIHSYKSFSFEARISNKSLLKKEQDLTTF